MTATQIVLKVISALESLGIPYMLVGSFSSNAFGIARATNDADFVIEIGDASIAPLVMALAPEISLDPQLSFETVTNSSRFIATHRDTDFTIELFLRGEDAFQRERFARRRQRLFAGMKVWLPTPEDVVVQKLRWFARAGRNRDWLDTRNVVAVQFGKLDLAYIRGWCDRHGTAELFEKVLKEAEGILPEGE